LRKTIFLDRDGLINRCAAPHCYICKWEDFEFLPGAIEAISRFNAAGYLVLLVTNQRGVARGMLTQDALEALHGAMCSELEASGARIDHIYVCPHETGTCTCRKPGIGMFQMAERDYAIDKSRSWMIGDSQTDILAGRRYGVRTILTTDLLDAAQRILQAERNADLEMVQ